MLTDSPFRPAWWLPGPHSQTLWAAARRVPLPDLRYEELALPDGDFLELAHLAPPADAHAPTVLVVHGLAGSVHSPHVAGLLTAVARRGWRAIGFHFRGCGPRPNRTPTGYHSGKTDDVRHALQVLRARHPGRLAVAGFSLGANVVLKLLGEDGPDAPVDAAAAISPPLRLDVCADRMERGWSRLYQAALLHELRRYVRRKVAAGVAIDAAPLRRVRTFRDFDDAITAPLHGFDDAADYYARASSRPFLHRIAVPTLVIHAEDDPFFTPAVIPAEAELPPSVRFEFAPRGGHVAFVEGRSPLSASYHVDARIPAFFDAHLEVAR
jgi:predicted alpha/beta-fold hydrolase